MNPLQYSIEMIVKEMKKLQSKSLFGPIILSSTFGKEPNSATMGQDVCESV